MVALLGAQLLTKPVLHTNLRREIWQALLVINYVCECFFSLQPLASCVHRLTALCNDFRLDYIPKECIITLVWDVFCRWSWCSKCGWYGCQSRWHVRCPRHGIRTGWWWSRRWLSPVQSVTRRSAHQCIAATASTSKHWSRVIGSQQNIVTYLMITLLTVYVLSSLPAKTFWSHILYRQRYCCLIRHFVEFAKLANE